MIKVKLWLCHSMPLDELTLSGKVESGVNVCDQTVRNRLMGLRYRKDKGWPSWTHKQGSDMAGWFSDDYVWSKVFMVLLYAKMHLSSRKMVLSWSNIPFNRWNQKSVQNSMYTCKFIEDGMADMSSATLPHIISDYGNVHVFSRQSSSHIKF